MLSGPVSCQLRGLALSPGDKLRVITLDFAQDKGSVFPVATQDGTVSFLASTVQHDNGELGRLHYTFH